MAKKLPDTEASGRSSQGVDDTEPEKRDMRRRVLWRESEEYKALNKWRWVILVVGLVLAVCVGTLFYVLSDLGGSRGLKLLYSAYAGLIIGTFPLLLFNMRAKVERGAFDDRLTLGLVSELQNEEQQLAEAEGNTDLASLWAITQKRIDLYHSIATSQAQNSFRVAQVSAMAGFVAILSLGGLAAFSDGTSAIAASVVGVAGAAMGGYIGATFMKAQAEASVQLRAFFLQPVQFSRMLGAERLLDGLPDPERAAAVQLIIKSMMGESASHE